MFRGWEEMALSAWKTIGCCRSRRFDLRRQNFGRRENRRRPSRKYSVDQAD
jgi:hypothetical protein